MDKTRFLSVMLGLLLTVGAGGAHALSITYSDFSFGGSSEKGHDDYHIGDFLFNPNIGALTRVDIDFHDIAVTVNDPYGPAIPGVFVQLVAIDFFTPPPFPGRLFWSDGFDLAGSGPGTHSGSATYSLTSQLEDFHQGANENTLQIWSYGTTLGDEWRGKFDITYHYYSVPAPTTFAALLAGLCCIGMSRALRRRRR